MADPKRVHLERSVIWSAPSKEKQAESKGLKGLVSYTAQHQHSGRDETESKQSEACTWNFGEFGKYMNEKTRKLREQFQSDATERLFQPPKVHRADESLKTVSLDGLNNIFEGVTIWVNGYTTPPHQELRRLMLAHGGIFENYYSNSRVTHIICEHLPDGKYLDYRHKKKLPPILKPQWVTDSIKAGRLLPVDHYKLLRLAYDHPGQSTLDPTLKKSPAHYALEGSRGGSSRKGNSQGDLETEKEVMERIAAPDEGESMMATREAEEGGFSKPRPDAVNFVECGYLHMNPNSDGKSAKGGLCHEELVQSDNLACGPIGVNLERKQDLSDMRRWAIEDQAGMSMEVAVERSNGPAAKGTPMAESVNGDQRAGQALILDEDEGRHGDGDETNNVEKEGRGDVQRGSATSPSKVVPARSHSTKGDPNFIQNYYKHSRLHFIGTWRNRYQAAHGSAGPLPFPESLREGEREMHGSHGRSGEQPPVPKVGSAERTILHIDMDCFFVSVVVRNRPELVNESVAVCHSDSSRGTAEISSANYVARKFGVKAGMFMREAKSRCPNLVVLPYDFEAYQEVADQVYSILHRHSSVVQALSCDEAFLDITGLGDANEIALSIRKEIFQTTRCTASAGIGPNLLLARLATRRAKPDGQLQVSLAQASEFVADLPVADLHGVGWALRDRLHSKGVKTCADLLQLSLETLQREFGEKTGDMLHSYARGRDSRSVQSAQERKSIGAEVNWGVRFSNDGDAQTFLQGLVEEVCRRLSAARVKGRTLCLKAKKRKADAPKEPAKFMGCGACDNLSRSANLGAATDDPLVLLKVSRRLYAALQLNPLEVRGVGLQVTRLDSSLGGGRSGFAGGGSLQGRLSAPWGSGEQRGRAGRAEGGDVGGDPHSEAEEAETVMNSEQQPELGGGVEHEELEVREAVKRREEGLGVRSVEVIQGEEGKEEVEGRGMGFREQTKGERLTEGGNFQREGDAREESLQVKDKAVIQAPFLPAEGVSGEAGPSMQQRVKESHGLPSVSQLDPTVLAELPEQIIAELKAAYDADWGSDQWNLRKQEVVGRCEMKRHCENLEGMRNGGETEREEEEALPHQLMPNGSMINPKDSEGTVCLDVALANGSRQTEMDRGNRDITEHASVEVLPPASQLDHAVLDALPLELRRELERAYKQREVGIRRRASSPPRTHTATGMATRGRKRAQFADRGDRKRQRTLFQLVKTNDPIPQRSSHSDTGGGCSESTVSHFSEEYVSKEDMAELTSNAANSMHPAADCPTLRLGGQEYETHAEQRLKPTEEREHEGLASSWSVSLTQIDKQVLSELPQDVQEDVLRIAPPHRKDIRGSCGSILKGEEARGMPSVAQVKEVTNFKVKGPQENTLKTPLWITFLTCKYSKNSYAQFPAETAASKNGPSSLSQALKQVWCSGCCQHVPPDVAPSAAATCSAAVVEYAERVVERDLEEVAALAAMLRRLASQWPVWQLVESSSVPVIQDMVRHLYGGQLTGYGPAVEKERGPISGGACICAAENGGS